MRNIFLTLMVTVFMGTGLMSCAALEAVFGEGTVFTTADQVVEGGEAAVIPFDQLPDSIKAQFPEGTALVMTSKDALVEGASFIPAGGDLDEGGWDGIFQTALGIGTAFLPGLAAWEGVLTLFSQRKRNHYVKAAKAILPTDKNIDLGGMLGSLAAAVGASHSSEGTAVLHAEEEEEEYEAEYFNNLTIIGGWDSTPHPPFFVPIMKRKLRILCSPANEGGCSYYRVISPMRKLQELYGDQVEFRYNLNPLGIVESGDKIGTWQKDWGFDDMKWADIIWTNNISNWGGPYTARIVGKAKEFGKFVHFDTDDLLTDLYKGHRLYDTYKERNLEEITKFIYNNSDLVTVTQRKFAERVKPFCGGVLAIVKNAIDYNMPSWNVPKSKPANKKVIRVGWAGGIHHEEDIKEFAGVPNMVNQRVGRENVHWGFYGAPLANNSTDGKKDEWQHEVWRNYKKIILQGFKGQPNWQIYNALPPDAYGGLYSQVDLAIAPLQMNAFNDSKSEIKIAECGRYKIPLIASDVGCYDETIINGKTGYLLPANAPKSEWVKVLTKCIKNPNHVRDMGEALHEITEEFFDLNNVVKHRMELYEQSLGLVQGRDGDAKNTYNNEWTFND